MTDHSWPDGVYSTEWSLRYRFREEEDRGLFDEDVDAVEASLGACASSIERARITADVHFKSMLLAMDVRYAGSPEHWSTGLNAREN